MHSVSPVPKMIASAYNDILQRLCYNIILKQYNHIRHLLGECSRKASMRMIQSHASRLNHRSHLFPTSCVVVVAKKGLTPTFQQTNIFIHSTIPESRQPNLTSSLGSRPSGIYLVIGTWTSGKLQLHSDCRYLHIHHTSHGSHLSRRNRWEILQNC